jgi:hypothetical protein
MAPADVRNLLAAGVPPAAIDAEGTVDAERLLAEGWHVTTTYLSREEATGTDNSTRS